MIADILRRKKITVDRLGEIELRELAAVAQLEINAVNDAGRENDMFPIACRYGVVGWEDETPASIAAKLPIKTIIDIATQIFELSGMQEDPAKNSESGQIESSSSVSPLISKSA